MRFEPVFIKDKLGHEIELRSAELTDADALVSFLKITAAETPYLIREPDEIDITYEDERYFIQNKLDSDRELLLIALDNGKHIGNCALISLGKYRRYAHRCQVAIALYQEYCGRGIGRALLSAVLDTARRLGYEQAELEVMADNKKAISLYEKLGFVKYGSFPNNSKYQDGSYSDAYWMMKLL